MIYIYFTVCQSKFNILEWKKYIEKKIVPGLSWLRICIHNSVVNSGKVPHTINLLII